MAFIPPRMNELKSFAMFTLKVAGALIIVNFVANVFGGGYNKGLINQVVYGPDTLIGATNWFNKGGS